MPNSFAPPGESAADLWLERSNFVGGVLGGVAYGVHLAVFVSAMHFMLKERRKNRTSWFFIVFTFVLFTAGTITIAGTTLFDERVWIDDRGFPGGPPAFQTEEFSNSANTIGNSAYIFGNFLADGILVYRLFIVYNRNYWIALIPFLTFLSSTALSILTLVQSAEPGGSLWTHNAILFAVPYWSMSIGLNILITLAIAARLFYMRNAVITHLGDEHAKTYTSVAAMVVESGALFSTTGMVYLICYTRNSNVQNLMLPILAQVMCIAPELIILRVARGRAWTAHTAHPPVSSLKARVPTVLGSSSDGTTTFEIHERDQTITRRAAMVGLSSWPVRKESSSGGSTGASDSHEKVDTEDMLHVEFAEV